MGFSEQVVTGDRGQSSSNEKWGCFHSTYKAQVTPGVFNQYAGFYNFSLFFFFALASPVPSIDGSWLDLPASPYSICLQKQLAFAKTSMTTTFHPK